MLNSIFSAEMFMPEIDSFSDGISSKDLKAQYGAKDDPRFLKKLTEIDQQTLLLPGYRKTGTSLGR